MNYLFYGDNLDVLRKDIPDESVDLIYLDPPFNSNRSYNVLFADRSGDDAQAQIEAFDDTWTWSQDAEAAYDELVGGDAPAKVADAVEAMRRLLGDNDVLAYLVMMTGRLVELHRVLKRTGSLYLHCDPTASHYLKVVLDAVFGAKHFRGEITWLRTTTHGDAKRWSPNADILLYYGKSIDVTWNPVYIPHSTKYIESKYRHQEPDGRRYRLDNMTSPNPRPNLTYEWQGHAPPANGWRYSKERMAQLAGEGRIWYPDSKSKRPQLKRYLDEMPGTVAGNVWTDVPPINSQAAERLGYPTQKPETLLERIIQASSNEGDVVLDPFCGCGTTVAVAQRLRRQWVGIDVTFLAVDLIAKRLIDTYGVEVAATFEARGIPRDLAGAKALFAADPFDFERWAVSLVGAQPNLRQVGDKGADGVVRFPLDGSKAIGRALVSVKGGGRLNPGMVRDLVGTVASQRAELGVFITLEEPTRGMVDAARHSGTWTWPVTGKAFPTVQIVTVADLLDGRRPDLPPAFLPYVKARRAALGDQGRLAL